MVSPTAAIQKRKKQSVESKEVTKQKGAKVATKDEDDNHEGDADEDEEELSPGEDKINL